MPPPNAAFLRLLCRRRRLRGPPYKDGQGGGPNELAQARAHAIWPPRPRAGRGACPRAGRIHPHRRLAGSGGPVSGDARAWTPRRRRARQRSRLPIHAPIRLVPPHAWRGVEAPSKAAARIVRWPVRPALAPPAGIRPLCGNARPRRPAPNSRGPAKCAVRRCGGGGRCGRGARPCAAACFQAPGLTCPALTRRPASYSRTRPRRDSRCALAGAGVQGTRPRPRRTARCAVPGALQPPPPPPRRVCDMPCCTLPGLHIALLVNKSCARGQSL